MINIQYKDVKLRPFVMQDIENKVKWINNPMNNEFLHYEIPLNYDKTLKWYYAKDNSARLDLVIEYEDIPVGLVGLLNIDKKNKKAEFYISMGEPQFKNRGIATKACKALIKYAFNNLYLHKIYLNTDGTNFVAHRLFEKVGFVREGVFIDDMIHHNRYIDRIRYALLNNSTGEKQ